MDKPERPRLLIVDDTPENIHVLMEILKADYTLVAATSGSKALRLARQEPRPDLILLDVMMPELDGYQVCAELKADETTRRIPVIFVTGLAEAGEEERGLSMGAVDYVVKPIQPALLRARLHNHLELKRHQDFLEEEVARRTRALLDADAARQRLEGELDVARRLHLSMLPRRSFEDRRQRGCRLSTWLQSARAVGGDLYDYFFIDEERLLFAIGDVSDKGVAAALFMVQVRTVLRALAPSSTDPGQLLIAINESLCMDNDACMFVTLICGTLDLRSGEVMLASGGHEPPVRAGPGGESVFLEFENGPALGLFSVDHYPIYRFRLEPGESLILYTDGVTEASDIHQECYGPTRLLQVIDHLAHTQPGEIVTGVQTAIEKFAGEAEQSDDITLLVLKTHLDIDAGESDLCSTKTYACEGSPSSSPASSNSGNSSETPVSPKT